MLVIVLVSGVVNSTLFREDCSGIRSGQEEVEALQVGKGQNDCIDLPSGCQVNDDALFSSLLLQLTFPPLGSILVLAEGH
jgi:hypothetical protein